MSMNEIYANIEAILFTMGESVELEKIAAAIGHDLPTTIKIMNNLMDKYKSKDRGIKIIELDGSYQMCTKAETYDAIVKVATQPKKHMLTDVLLETLSIVAYKQPITKQEIESIRGVSCDHAINKLVEYSLICEIGRLDAPGRPILFGTTEEFLRCFGVKSIEDLPVINNDVVENFRHEAEEETDEEFGTGTETESIENTHSISDIDDSEEE